MTTEHRLQRAIRQWMDALDNQEAESLSVAAEEISLQLTRDHRIGLFLAALSDTTNDDPLDCAACQDQLPDFIHALTVSGGVDGPCFSDVRSHLRHCPYCITALAEVTQWLEASERDAIPTAQAYPTFLTPPPPASGIVTEPSRDQAFSPDLLRLLGNSLESGQRWLSDSANGLMILLTGGPEMDVEWALKSGETETLLAQTVLTDGETDGWEIEVSAFTMTSDMCQVEVALFTSETESELGGIAISLVQPTGIRQEVTDEAGVVTFADISLESLPRLGVHVVLPVVKH